MGRRGKKGGPMGGKWNISHSLQMRLALGYSCLIAVLLVLMNTYPLIMGQNLMFRSQQTALANQLVLITNTLTTADELTPETVEQAIGQLEELEVRRVLVTDGAGRVLYDTGEPSALGKYALIGEVVSALRGNDAFSSEYQDGAFSSRAASPVMNRNQVVGAVCLYDQDSDQGALLEELQRNLRLISVVVCLAVLVLFGAFSTFLSRRVRTLLGGIRTVRAGEYTHRISMDGHDELAQLAEEFNQLTGRLQVTEEERRRFVSDASHELKTPLASIRLLTDSILQDASIDRDTAREFVADIGRRRTVSSTSVRNYWSSTAWTRGGTWPRSRWTGRSRWRRSGGCWRRWRRRTGLRWRPTWGRTVLSGVTRRTPVRSCGI